MKKIGEYLSATTLQKNLPGINKPRKGCRSEKFKDLAKKTT